MRFHQRHIFTVQKADTVWIQVSSEVSVVVSHQLLKFFSQQCAQPHSGQRQIRCNFLNQWIELPPSCISFLRAHSMAMSLHRSAWRSTLVTKKRLPCCRASTPASCWRVGSRTCFLYCWLFCFACVCRRCLIQWRTPKPVNIADDFTALSYSKIRRSKIPSCSSKFLITNSNV